LIWLSQFVFLSFPLPCFYHFHDSLPVHLVSFLSTVIVFIYNPPLCLVIMASYSFRGSF
jgi:hypothetical protein